jgi:Omp85 superfamily domain
MTKRALWALLIAMIASATSAGAAEPTPSPKRPLPDYSGRPPDAPPGQAALWIPRVAFFPLYFTSEFLIRRPLGALVSAAERAHLPRILYDFFAFGPDHKAGFAPIAFVDFGFNPSVGLYLFWDDAIFKGDDLRLHASVWTSDWLAGSFAQRIHFYGNDSLTLRVGASRRPDYVYYGPGPNTLQASQSRYGEDSLDGGATVDLPLWRSSRVRAGVGVRSRSFRDGHYGRDPSITSQVRARVFPLPDGFAQGYTAEYNRVLVAIDSRRPYPAPGSGLRLEGQVEQGSDFGQSPASGWLSYRAAAAGFLDVNDHRRVISLSVSAIFSDPLGTRAIPFTELVTLGGDELMPGFYPGRLVDRSAAIANLRYRWPIGPWLDGSMQAAIGNVFGVHLEDFDPKLFRLSAALGLETDTSPDSNFSILVGFGTETFDHGGQVNSFRLALGTSRGL